MTKKTDDFLTELQEHEWQVRQSSGEHLVLAPSDPIDGEALWGPTDPENPYFDAIDHLNTRTVIEFWWDDGMPASTAEISVFSDDARTYVDLPPDPDMDRGWLIVAALEPASSRPGFGMFLIDYLSSNGIEYGAEIFGGLPNRIEVHDQGLVEQAMVRQAIEAWARWATEQWNYELPDDGEPGWLDSYLTRAYEVV